MDVIDRFLETFIRYIDSGFGLLQGDVAYLTSTLIVIDITLAGLFWALSQNADVIAGLIKKVLYVGFFAFLLGNFAGLSQIIFDSFAGLGLKAGSSLITAEDLMRPGYIAGVGYGAALPLLEEASEMMGPIAFFENFILIAVLLIAWAVILIAFFVLAVQLFVAILEFKLTTLAGFVLVPFALWNKTSFLAERVLGNVITSGLKLMVLAIIIGIGSTLFSTITEAFAGTEDVTLAEVMGTVLAATVFLWMGVFGPGMASGLITGAPQLGAGSAIGAAAGVAAGTVAAGLGAKAALGAAAGGAASAVTALLALPQALAASPRRPATPRAAPPPAQPALYAMPTGAAPAARSNPLAAQAHRLPKARPPPRRRKALAGRAACAPPRGSARPASWPCTACATVIAALRAPPPP
jgi:type IV secretion system protein TrbL